MPCYQRKYFTLEVFPELGHRHRMLLSDIKDTIHRRDLVIQLGCSKPVLGLRSTMIGPLWIMLSFGVFVGGLGLLWSRVLNSPVSTLVPHVALGMIVFVFLTGSVIDGARAITSGGRIALQNRLPIVLLASAAVVKQMTIAAYSVPVVILALILFPPAVDLGALASFAGVALVTAFAAGCALLLSLICVYARDLTELLTASMRFMFFLTPVIWIVEDRPSLRPVVVLNPFHHAINVVRGPITGSSGVPESFWAILGLTVFVWATAWLVYQRTAHAVLLRI